MANQNIMVVLSANTSQFSSAMRRVQAQMNATAQSLNRSMGDVEKNTKKSTNGIGGHFAKLGGVIKNFSLTATKIGGFTSLLSATIPVLASASAGAMALGGALASAGAGMMGFGAVAITTLGKVFTATDKTFKNLDAQQQKAYKSLKSFKDFWKGFASEFEKPTVDIFTKGLSILQTVITALKPAIAGTMTAVNGLMDSLTASIKAPDIQKFLQWIGSTAGTFVTGFGKIFGNVFRGVINLLMAFSPLSTGVVNGLVGMTKQFADWSSTIGQSTGFQDFIKYVQTNTPTVIGLIGDIFHIVSNLIGILAPLGQVALNTIKQITGALSTFTDAVKNSFSEGNFTGVGQAIGDLLPVIIQTLLGGLPHLIQTGMQMINGIAEGMGKSVPELATMIVNILAEMISSFVNALPMIVNTGVQLLTGLIQGIVNAIPTLLALIPTILNSLIAMIVQNLPVIINAGIQLIMGLIQGIVSAIPSIIQAVISFTQQFINTILGMIPQLIQSAIYLINALVQGLTTALPQLVDMTITLINTILNAIVDNLPQIINAGISLLNSLIAGVLKIVPQLIPLVLKLFNTILDAIINNLPTIINAGVQLLLALINGIVNMLPQLVTMAVKLIIELVGALLAHLPELIVAGIKILVALIGGLIQAIPKLVGAIPQIIGAIFKAFAEVNWLDIGINIVKGIGKGLASMGKWLWGMVKDMAKGLLDGAKKLLGIHSPSKVFADEVGKYIPQGIAVGVEADTGKAVKSIGNMNKSLVAEGSSMNLSAMVAPVPKLNNQGSGDTINNHIIINATVREEADLDKLTKRIKRIQTSLDRAGGVVDYGY